MVVVVGGIYATLHTFVTCAPCWPEEWKSCTPAYVMLLPPASFDLSCLNPLPPLPVWECEEETTAPDDVLLLSCELVLKTAPPACEFYCMGENSESEICV